MPWADTAEKAVMDRVSRPLIALLLATIVGFADRFAIAQRVQDTLAVR